MGDQTPIPLTEAGALKAFRPITNSAKAPCAMQREVAAHNAVYDSLKQKKELVYRAPCDLAPSKKTAPSA